jgi:hypothetical protein
VTRFEDLTDTRQGGVQDTGVNARGVSHTAETATEL